MRLRQISIAFTVILFILSVAHFVLYEGLLIGLQISGEAVVYLKVLLFLLDISFVVASLSAFRWNNLASRIFYRVSAVWLGALLYFFLAAVIVIVGTALFAPSVPVSLFWFILAAVMSAYAVLHASTIKVKEITIPLPGLPNEWEGRKAVFLSDIHLGQVRGSGFSKKIVAKIVGLKPDIIFIGGDIYDGVKVDVDEVIAPFKELSLPLGVFSIMGNHEEFSDGSLYAAAMQRAGMTVLVDSSVEIEGVQIVGVDFRTTKKAETFYAVLKKIGSLGEKPSILLKHTPLHVDVANAAGFNLMLSGHTHKAQVFPFTLMTKSIFKGFDYGLRSYAKTLVYTSSGIGTWGPPLRVGTDSELVVITFTQEVIPTQAGQGSR